MQRQTHFLKYEKTRKVTLKSNITINLSKYRLDTDTPCKCNKLNDFLYFILKELFEICLVPLNYENGKIDRHEH